MSRPQPVCVCVCVGVVFVQVRVMLSECTRDFCLYRMETYFSLFCPWMVSLQSDIHPLTIAGKTHTHSQNLHTHTYISVNLSPGHRERMGKICVFDLVVKRLFSTFPLLWTGFVASDVFLTQRVWGEQTRQLHKKHISMHQSCSTCSKNSCRPIRMDVFPNTSTLCAPDSICSKVMSSFISK